MLEFQFIKLMGVIFTPDLIIGNKLKLADLFQVLSGNKFDGELISVPIPQNAPFDFPRIILNSQDGAWKLEVSPARTNIIFLKPLNLSIFVPSAVDFANFVKNIFTAYVQTTQTKVQRLAFVSERYAKINEIDPPSFIANRYCREEYTNKIFKNLEAFEIHALKKYKLEGFDINSWVRLKSANLSDEAKTPILLLINDINTLSESDISFSEKQIQHYFEIIPEHLEKITGLYI